VEFEDGQLIKPGFITMDEMKACQLTRTKLRKNKNKKNPSDPIKKYGLHLQIFSSNRNVKRKLHTT
jgi:hypothetical protein